MPWLVIMAPSKPPFPLPLYLSLVATGLFALGLTTLIPILPLFITDGLHASEDWIGTSMMLVSLLAVATRIPSGVLSDRQGRRRIMITGAALGVLAGACYVATTNIPILLVARVLSGASLGLFTTAAKAFAADLTPPARRGEALGLTNAAFSVGSIFSPICGEGLRHFAGFDAVFLLSGILMALALVISLTLPGGKIHTPSGVGARRDIRDTFAQRGTWAAFLLMLGCGPILAMMFTFYPLLAERKDLYADAPRAFSAVAMSIGLSVWALLDTLTGPVAGRLSDRIGRRRIAIPGVLLALAGLFGLSQSSGTVTAYTSIAVMVIGWSTARSAADAMSQDAVSPALRGMAAAVVYSSLDLMVGFSSQTLGLVIDDSDFTLFFWMIAFLTLIFAVPGILLASGLKSYERRTEELLPIHPAITGD